MILIEWVALVIVGLSAGYGASAFEDYHDLPRPIALAVVTIALIVFVVLRDFAE